MPATRASYAVWALLGRGGEGRGPHPMVIVLTITKVTNGDRQVGPSHLGFLF